MMISFATRPWLNDRPWAVVGWAVLATITPFVLEIAGVFAETSEMTPDGLLIHGTVFVARTARDSVAITIANVVIVLIVGLFALGVARDRRKAERQLYAQAWHLKQLLPREG
jgi:hypothetical protein